ncbi:DUF3800 domain-containing protein [Longibaculum muris]|uniref:DUF3800 domain-containing protein n=1 Tax=Longibaculum muris TaxID=1796628 RepID=UPI0022E6B481|nr:DUF3800 domain-containing protein [Longibaculum muris]
MNEYYLFLDESKPNSNFKNFTLAGYAISKNEYETKLKPEILSIKKECFNNEKIILHEIDIRKGKGDFVGRTKNQYELFFQRIREIFKKVEFVVLGVSINIDDFEQLYGNEETNQIYYISLQLLMENYNHFLISNNACGCVYLESTDSTNNTMLQNLFHQLKSTGTLFYSKESLQKHLTTINFIPKSDNNVGVQFADFIPNPLAREALGKEQKEYSLLSYIKMCLYDGKISMESRFGFKIIG